jgi:hypothetical protein
MNICPGCNERVTAGEEECSHCGTPLTTAVGTNSAPVIAGRKTYIAGASEKSGGPQKPGQGGVRKTRVGGAAPAPSPRSASDDLYVPKGRRGAGATPLDPRDPFARAVVGGGTAPDTASSGGPSGAPEPRSKTHFWSADPDSKPTLVGEGGGSASDPWAASLSKPPPSPSSRVQASDSLAGVLISFSLDAAGKSYPIRRGKTAIGRAGDPGLDVELDDGKISSPHCMIIARPSGVFLQDSMSTNGTWFRRGELTEFEDIQATMNNSARLEDGDFFRVGDSIFLVRLLDADFVDRVWGQ